MGYIKFKKKKTVTKAIVSEESPHVIRITGDNITVNTDGFRLYLDADCKYPLDNGEYAAYTTLYREGDGWYELSMMAQYILSQLHRCNLNRPKRSLQSRHDSSRSVS